MKIRVYNSMAMTNISVYETDEIVGIGDYASDEELTAIANDTMTPMLNFKTYDGHYLAVPFQFLIDIKE